jgi:tetratricopeptide (TPR) repeat protein
VGIQQSEVVVELRTPWDSFERFEAGSRPDSGDFVERGAYILWLSRADVSAALVESRSLRDDCLAALGPDDPLTQRAEERLRHYEQAGSAGVQIHVQAFTRAATPPRDDLHARLLFVYWLIDRDLTRAIDQARSLRDECRERLTEASAIGERAQMAYEDVLRKNLLPPFTIADLEQTHTATLARLGPDHQETWDAAALLAWLLAEEGQESAADSILATIPVDKQWEVSRRRCWTVQARYRIPIKLAIETGDFEAAAEMQEKVLAQYVDVYGGHGEDQVYFVRELPLVVSLVARAGRIDDALVRSQLMDSFTDEAGSEMLIVADVLHDAGRSDEALAIIDRVIRENQGDEANYSLGEGSSLHEDGLRRRAAILSGLGRYGEALSTFAQVPDLAYLRTDEPGARQSALEDYDELLAAATRELDREIEVLGD